MSNAIDHVLVVDDDPVMRLLIDAALKEVGFAVALAENGDQALAIFHSGPLDLVLLDVEMPGLSGFEVCEQIRAADQNDIPVVMVTGHEDIFSIAKAYKCGATDFITKPINWPLLGYRLHYILRGSRAVQSLHRAEAQKYAILRALPDLLLRVNTDGDILEQHGYACSQIDGACPQATLAEMLPPAGQWLDAIRKAVTSGAVQTLAYDIPAEGGQTSYFEGRIAPIGSAEVVCLIRDTTQRCVAEQRVRYLGYFDALTGLPNRLALLEDLDHEITRARVGGGKIALLFIAIDDFGGINGYLGHRIGDRLLQNAADRLRAHLAAPNGKPIKLARLGGGEFALLVPAIGQADDTLSVAQRVRICLAHPFEFDGQELLITACIGIGIYPDDATNADTLLKCADTATRAARTIGPGHWQYYKTSLTEQAVSRLAMESALRQALARGEFELVYQPQVDAHTRAVHAVEALIRWRHPTRGLIQPMEFIPLTEENGLIIPIGDWVLRTALADAMRWQAAGLPAIRVAVNLSPVQFRNPHLRDNIRNALLESGLPPERLELEITEGVLLGTNSRALAIMTQLRESGVMIALDDFGTGFSSLQYLKQLPLSTLKIDRVFVRDITSSREDQAIVRAVITLAYNLDMNVIAEGVETAAQADAVTGLGCHTIQGFHIAKPMSFDEIAQILTQPVPDQTD